MKVSFVLDCGLYSKTGKWVLSRKRDNMIQIQDMFEDGKPDIVLKTVKRFNLKRTPIIILIPENSFKLRIVVLVMLNKMLVIILIIDFYSRFGLGS